MKKLFFFLPFLVVTNFLFAQQWTTSGINVYNTNTGNVGIGVTNPTAKLEIVNNGSGNASLRVGITSNRANMNTQLNSSLAVVANNSSSIAINGAVAWDHYNNGTSPSFAGTFIQHFGTAITGNQYGIPAANQGTLVFQNVANGVIGSNGASIFISPANVFSTVFSSNGSVGIGTTATGSFKLAVEGKIGAREIQVTQTTPWPDYVFAPTYKLKPLSEVENFVKLFQHLPDVPSADDTKDGVELGKMNIILLQKVEELTLYLIEINKKVEQLESQNQMLLKQN